MEVIIAGVPVPWKAHAGYGKRSFNPRFKEKEYVQWQVKSQINQEQFLQGAIHIHCVFHLPIPKGTSKVRHKEMLDNRLHHIKRPDLTNLYKFIEDCLKGLIFEDDSQVCDVILKKIYSAIPKTVISVTKAQAGRGSSF